MAGCIDLRGIIENAFDEAWYLEKYPDVAAAGLDPIEHYLASGAFEGRDPHPLFNTSWYLEHNPDGEGRRLNALAHYLLVGAREGRDPHPLFATTWYVENNPQVAETGINALVHYITGEAHHLKNPHPLFDGSWYLRAYPDVSAAKINPLVHYLRDGDREGRCPNPLFDPAWYLQQCSNGQLLGMTTLEHYLAFGAKAGYDPHPLFDTTWYAQQCSQNQLADISALQHYFQIGAASGYSPHPLFDSNFYGEKYPEVERMRINPLVHYLTQGSSYGTEPHPLFRGNWYRLTYLHELPLSTNPLVHYITTGSQKNLDPSPEFSGVYYTSRYGDIDWNRTNPFVHYITKGRKEGRAPASMPVLYQRTRRTDEEILSKTAFETQRYMSRMLLKPRFLIHISGDNKERYLQTLGSVHAQFYKNYSVLAREDLEAVVEALGHDTEVYFMWLEAGDVLKDAALYHFARAVNRSSSLDIIYGDEEVLLHDGTIIPFYKPAWSPDYLESFNYIGRSVCYRMTFASQAVCRAENSFGLLLELTEKTGRIAHLREMISTCPDRRYGTEADIRSDLSILNHRTCRSGRRLNFIPDKRSLRLYQFSLPRDFPLKLTVVLYNLDSESAIVSSLPRFSLSNAPTKSPSDFGLPASAEIELITVSASDENEYPLQMDRGATEIESCSRDLRTLADALNYAVGESTGQYIVFIPNETANFTMARLSNMARHFSKSKVGAVGAKLLTPDERIVQFGLILSDGMKRQMHHGCRNEAEGYFFSQSAARNFRAVDLEGLMTEKELFLSVGGFDPSIRSHNISTDYCLKLKNQGRRVVCDPNSAVRVTVDVCGVASRSSETSFESDSIFFDRWRAHLIADPFYNQDRFIAAPPAYDGIA